MYSDQLKDIWLEGISYSEHANHRPTDNFFAIFFLREIDPDILLLQDPHTDTASLSILDSM